MYLIIQSRYLFSDSCQSLKMWIFSTYHIFCRGLCVSTLHCLMNCLIWLFLTWFLFFVVVVVVVTWFFIWRENNQSNLYSFSMPPWLHRIASFFVSSSGLKSTSLCSYSSWGRCSVTLCMHFFSEPFPLSSWNWKRKREDICTVRLGNRVNEQFQF